MCIRERRLEDSPRTGSARRELVGAREDMLGVMEGGLREDGSRTDDQPEGEKESVGNMRGEVLTTGGYGENCVHVAGCSFGESDGATVSYVELPTNESFNGTQENEDGKEKQAEGEENNSSKILD